MVSMRILDTSTLDWATLIWARLTLSIEIETIFDKHDSNMQFEIAELPSSLEANQLLP